jgi:hypothetical protein
MAIEIKLNPPITDVPDDHLRDAERKAEEAYVLALFRQGDITAARVAELLGKNQWPAGFFEKTPGAWAGERLTRGPQGDYEVREELA